MACKNICEQLKDRSVVTAKQYSSNRKYCRRCEVFLKAENIQFCPCCGMKLRCKGKSRVTKYRQRQKQKLQEAIVQKIQAIIQEQYLEQRRLLLLQQEEQEQVPLPEITVSYH